MIAWGHRASPKTHRPTHTQTRSDARTRRSTQRQGDTDRGTATQICGIADTQTNRHTDKVIESETHRVRETPLWSDSKPDGGTDRQMNTCSQRQSHRDICVMIDRLGAQSQSKSTHVEKAFVSRVSARPISRAVIERHTEIDGETHRHARNERVIGDVYRQIARHTATDVSRDRETYSSHIKSHRQQHRHRLSCRPGVG